MTPSTGSANRNLFKGDITAAVGTTAAINVSETRRIERFAQTENKTRGRSQMRKIILKNRTCQEPNLTQPCLNPSLAQSRLKIR